MMTFLMQQAMPLMMRNKSYTHMRRDRVSEVGASMVSFSLLAGRNNLLQDTYRLQCNGGNSHSTNT